MAQRKNNLHQMTLARMILADGGTRFLIILFLALAAGLPFARASVSATNSCEIVYSRGAQGHPVFGVERCAPTGCRIEGFAIVSADGAIAHADGTFPTELENDVDKKYFEDALKNVSLVVHGKNSREIHKDSDSRRRLILSHSVQGLKRDEANPKTWYWNPDQVSFKEALNKLEIDSGLIAIIGGPQVYKLFLELGYDRFNINQVVNVNVPGGIALLTNASPDTNAALKAAGLSPIQKRLSEDIVLTEWERPGH